MNVYDFDGTIYHGDSTIDFYLFCIKKHKKIIINIPLQIGAFILYKCKIIGKLQFKQNFFKFLKKVADVDITVQEFWNIYESKIYTWYLLSQRENDVIVSASPEFLLREVFQRKKISNYICTKVDKKTGKFHSMNCYGEEKVRRFLKEYSVQSIDKFYSDSLSDLPMAHLAKEAILIDKNGKQHKWKI